MSGSMAEASRRALLAAPLLLPALARAQEFPARSIRIVVPYGPGGSSDIVARILAQRATELSGQTVVVENRGGGASIPGTQAVIGAPADGYTLGTADNALVVNPGLFRERMPFDVERDLAPLGLAVTAPLVLLANPAAKARDVKGVLAEMRAGPTGLSHGGIGTPTHLTVVEFLLATGLEPTVVGYRGGGPQLTGLVAGDVPYGFVAISSAMTHIQGGRLRPLALTGTERNPALPEVPTMAEAGLPEVTTVGWWGFIMPTGVPAPIQARLRTLLLEPAKEAAVRARLEGLGYSVVAGDAASFGARIRQETAQWRERADRAGLKPE
ncbi:tripartite tricarboxylate transporter substrate binding protein [Siccirubricoccus sp. KC 17139]|uniref:Tripartite tricarboxylate transporter substrate binding protein n=1 Tax=Siccirubricoccus soli TaxID=2899147 RepID=A0ABT1DCS7_9PROT|nr:tripartite tricarboxylate transporter substrate-binding protein [Siccirubricoccus soli]MCO6419736.1 tripartite tricarboxylate transporter substrate binding protein [Siccirubricoccus soli]MCP2685871.1 tripartite tricarboxylate transporter substrate-binding protein [Siccirubricoccus soli]